jgi:hypothetical protein
LRLYPRFNERFEIHTSHFLIERRIIYTITAMGGGMEDSVQKLFGK